MAAKFMVAVDQNSDLGADLGIAGLSRRQLGFDPNAAFVGDLKQHATGGHNLANHEFVTGDRAVLSGEQIESARGL